MQWLFAFISFIHYLCVFKNDSSVFLSSHKMDKQTLSLYESPTTAVVEVKPEGVICSSVNKTNLLGGWRDLGGGAWGGGASGGGTVGGWTDSGESAW